MTGVTVAGLVLVAVLVAGGPAAARLRKVLGRAGSPPDALDTAATDLPLLIDLVAAAMSAGAPPSTALELAADAVGGSLAAHARQVVARLRLGSDWPEAWRGAPAALEPLRRTLELAAAAGAPAAGLLLGTSIELRRRRRRAAEVAAQKLGVRLVLPLGLCALPAFLAWAVLPVVLSLTGQLLDAPP